MPRLISVWCFDPSAAAGADASIRDGNVSIRDVGASTQTGDILQLPGDASPDHSAVDAGASGNDVDALISMDDASTVCGCWSLDCWSIDDTGAEPSKTSSSILAKVDSIVTAGLGAEREPTKRAQNAKSTELYPIHNTGASDAKMEMAVNFDMMLFVNHSNIITVKLDKRANVPLHAVSPIARL